MLDMETPEGRVVAAALKLAETHDWPELGLDAIAREAGVPLVDMRGRFSSRSQILKAYVRAVDNAVLRRADSEMDADDSPRERLFDVTMMRLEAMAPHKAGIRRIVETGGAMPELTRPLLNAQRWMLAAAGVDNDGVPGLARTLGLTSIFADVFRTWLADDDAGLARTMARLDRRLRRSERFARQMNGLRSGCDSVMRDGGPLRDLAQRFRDGLRRRGRSGDESDAAATDGA